MYENALATIVALDNDVVGDVLEYVRGKLGDARIRQISKDDYFTYLTPDGELYDKSVVPG